MTENHIAYVCRKGSKPGPNQDDYCCLVTGNGVAQVIETKEVLLGVFDGHGANGHIISNMVQRLFPKVSLYVAKNSTAPDEKQKLLN